MKPVSVDIRRGERAVAMVLLALGVYVVFSGLGMPAGTFSTPGPGLFPRAIGTLLAVSSALVFVSAFRRHSGEATMADLGHRDILLVIVVMAVSAAVFAAFGAIASVLVMTALVVKILSQGTWWRAVVFSVLASATAWLLFVRLLGLQLPGFGLH
jgi:putative tricarboxylic transport membrane protein